jgi:hypothetical protein
LRRRRSAFARLLPAQFPQPSGDALPARANARIADSPILGKRALARFGLQFRGGLLVPFHVDLFPLTLTEKLIWNIRIDPRYSSENRALIEFCGVVPQANESRCGMMVLK